MKNKLILVLVILTLLLVVAVYIIMNKMEAVNNEIPLPGPAEARRIESTSTLTDSTSSDILEESDEEFLSAQFEQYIDKVEDEWNKSMENLFLYKNSTDKEFKEYQKLKAGYEQEREARYEAFHRMMEEKHGPNYTYAPSEDEEMFNEKLVKIYETNLSKVIGKEKMIEYLEIKDEFNKKLEQEVEGSDTYIIIEF